MTSLLRVASGPLIGCIVGSLLLANGVPFGPSYIAGLVAWMAFWWVTESVPIEVTALLPIIVIPFSGIYERNALGETCAPYADKNVFFFLGGFGLGLAIERTDLHRIGALYLLRIAGRNGANVIGAFMLATATSVILAHSMRMNCKRCRVVAGRWWPSSPRARSPR